MRRNERYTFTKKEDRPVLSLSDVRYWKRMLESIIKIGFEHEFNLSENKGRCNGKSMVCPCNHPEKDERRCYADCKIYKSCKLRKKYECAGIYCVEFVSPCPTCPDAVRDCSRCELFDNPDKKASKLRKAIIERLNPSHSLAEVGSNGVLEVVTDGSLLGGSNEDGGKGVEVTTVGRRVSFESFYDQSKAIMDSCRENGAYLNERCSMHVHLVAGYFTMVYKDGNIKVHYKKGEAHEANFSELEKPLPEIILANFHQLVRRYHNALTWITSAGEDHSTLTRWMKFRKPILQHSAVRRPMKKVINEIARSDEYHGRYHIVNYSPIKFEARGNNIRTFHLESRFCDGVLSPSAAAALGVLMYSLLLQAVLLSQFGIVHTGDRTYMEEAKNIQGSLLNNNGSWGGPRTSDTSNFEPYREKVRQQSNEMIDLLSAELKKHGPTLRILRELADMPCSMRLCRGDSWEKIESDISHSSLLEGKTANSIMSIVDTRYIDECIDINEWCLAASEDLRKSKKDINEITKKLMDHNIVAWDGVAGTLVRC